MRLDLTKRADYAIRAMLALAVQPRELRTGASVAAEANIPLSFMPQVMGDLVRGGLVERRLGRHGGYLLRRGPGEISLLEIIEAVEGDGRRRTCVMRGGSCGLDGYCSVHHAFFAAQEALFSTLEAATLASMATGELPAPAEHDAAS